MQQQLAALWFAFFMLAASPTHAADPSVAGLLARQRTISAGIESGTGPYGKLPGSVQSGIQAGQRRLEQLLDGKTTLSELAPSHRNEVLDLVTGIETALSDNRQRLACKQEARTGSNLMTRVCRTPSQIREEKEAGERLLGNERSRIKCNDDNGCM
ncbi:hypothetical protein DT603_06655 [Pseudoxanthomonas gei]|uniref:Uncharacterized protein n=1 Tax=Pseudoxanthomonas gei TaxID=1383030 RepID=A0ABX0AAF1_9GAMM|nr:hypothetical protein [Pseudoxanthomonas gei]NDK38522.1 hypothetical protein [Pseudoxanthomonas gei]